MNLKQAHKNAQIDNKKRIKVFDDCPCRTHVEDEQEPWVHDLKDSIEKGTKAWADVPADWVEELRGNDTPEVTPEVPCKTHPDAPHGFDRNASHSADRYVCECESWEPPKRDSSSWVAKEKNS